MSSLYKSIFEDPGCYAHPLWTINQLPKEPARQRKSQEIKSEFNVFIQISKIYMLNDLFLYYYSTLVFVIVIMYDYVYSLLVGGGHVEAVPPCPL